MTLGGLPSFWTGFMKQVQALRPVQCLLFLAAFLCFSIHSTALTPEGIAFLEFKAVLRNWSASDADPCGWSGVVCNHFSKRATALNLPYLLLGGTISPSIGKLKKLHRSSLHENRLHGFIPSRDCQL